MRKKSYQQYSIIKNHTLDEYKAKYDISKAIVLTKDGVDNFNKKHKHAKTKKNIFNGRNWWLIDGNYYEIGEYLELEPLVHKSRGAGFKIALTSILGCVGIVGALGGGGYVIYKAIQGYNPTPEPEPTIESLEFDGSSVKAKNKDISGKIVIPSTNPSTGEAITSIANSGFSQCKKITEIVIPDSVTTLGENCFWFCDNLETINLPSNLTTIGTYCFNNCYSLKSTIRIPASVTSIGYDAFEGCVSLEEIYVDSLIAVKNEPSDQYHPSSRLFDYPKKLYINTDLNEINYCEEITVNYTESSSIVKIGDQNYNLRTPNDKMYFRGNGNTWQTKRTFRCGTENIDDDFTIPTEDGEGNSVDSILSGAFMNNKKIKSITIPAAVSGNIGTAGWIGRSFYNCTNLKTVNWETSSSGSQWIVVEAFANCTALESIILNEKCYSIQTGAFLNCKKLNNVVIPGNVAAVYEDAFKGCDSLKKIYIDSLTVAKYTDNKSYLFNAETIELKTDLVSSLPSGCFILENYTKGSEVETGYIEYTKK